MSCWQTLDCLPAIRLASRHLFSRLFPTAVHRITWFSFGGKPDVENHSLLVHEKMF